MNTNPRLGSNFLDCVSGEGFLHLCIESLNRVQIVDYFCVFLPVLLHETWVGIVVKSTSRKIYVVNPCPTNTLVVAAMEELVRSYLHVLPVGWTQENINPLTEFVCADTDSGVYLLAVMYLMAQDCPPIFSWSAESVSSLRVSFCYRVLSKSIPWSR